MKRGFELMLIAAIAIAILLMPTSAVADTYRDSVSDSTGTAEFDLTNEYTWRASFVYAYDDLPGERSAWNMLHASVMREFGFVSIAFEGISSERFGVWDRTAAVDSYLKLWKGAYGNVRVQFSPSPHFSPELDTSVDLYHTFTNGWEASGGFRHRVYEVDSFHFISLGLGRYAGDWYIRGRATLLPYSGRLGTSASLAARRFGSDPLNYLEFVGGIGRGVEVVAPGPVIEQTETFNVGIRAQHFVTERFGISASTGYSDDEFFTRTTVTIGLMSRW